MLSNEERIQAAGLSRPGLRMKAGGQSARRVQPLQSRPDGPSRMGKRPTGSGGEPSSPNRGASAGVKARHPFFSLPLRRRA